MAYPPRNAYTGIPLMVLLLVVLVLILLACAPATPHGKAALDAWLRTHVQVIHWDLSTWPGSPCGGYLASPPSVVIDDACIARISGHNPRTIMVLTEWTYYHESAHALDAQVLGFARGVGDPVDFGILPRLEETAQCVAEIALGRTVGPMTMTSAEALRFGYWDCPPAEVARIRALMEAKGVW